MTENTIKTLQDDIAKEAKKDADDIEAKNHSETLAQKLNLIATSYEKFTLETEKISQRVTHETDKLVTLKRIVIHALYEAAKEFSLPILAKIQNAPLHIIKPLQTDFNKKFASIATISETAELSSLADAEKNLGKLSLEDLQDIISNGHKDAPGLLQKCNTSFTEESPELKIVMKHLGQLNEKLMPIFKDDPKYANTELTIITRIPVPRSFQFKFGSTVMNYNKVVDDFCKNQKDLLMRLQNHYKKILQMNNTDETALPSVDSLILAHITHEKTGDLQKLKDTTDTILAMANKDHDTTEKHQKNSQQLFESLKTNIDSHLKSLTSNIHFSMQKIQDDIQNANNILQKIITEKSQVDITISHYVLHPEENPDLNELDLKIKSLRDHLNQLFAKNKIIHGEVNRLAAYDTIVKRAKEINVSEAKANLQNERNEAKEVLLHIIQAKEDDPKTLEKTKKQALLHYTDIDTNTSQIDKTMNELESLKKAIFNDLDTHPELSTENLEMKFQTISEKMQVLTTAIESMNKKVAELKMLR